MSLGAFKPSIAVANLRQIAMIEGTAEACLPDLVAALRSFVRFDGFKMSWTDDRERVRAIWHVSPDMRAGSSSMVLFQDRFYNALEKQAVVATSALLKTPFKVDNCARYGTAFFDTELYDTILKPLGFKHALRLALHGGGRPVGFLTLTRGDDEKPFSTEDERRLLQVQEILSHAMAKPVEAKQAGKAESPLVPSGDTAMLICDLNGDLRHLSNDAQQFLNFIFAPDCLVADLDRPLAAQVRWWLLPLIRQLTTPAPSRANSAPGLYRQTKWGGFSARAYRLTPAEEGGDSLACVTLTRHVPLPLKLMRLQPVKALPRREKEVCLLLANGHSVPDIADRLSMSAHTVTGHVTSLYTRFNVSSRDQLMVLLLTAP